MGSFYYIERKIIDKVEKYQKRAQKRLRNVWLYGKIERLKIHTRSLCVIRVRKIFQCGRHYEPNTRRGGKTEV